MQESLTRRRIKTLHFWVTGIHGFFLSFQNKSRRIKQPTCNFAILALLPGKGKNGEMHMVYFLCSFVYSCYVVTFVKSVLIDFVRHDLSSAQTLSAGLAVQLKCPS